LKGYFVNLYNKRKTPGLDDLTKRLDENSKYVDRTVKLVHEKLYDPIYNVMGKLYPERAFTSDEYAYVEKLIVSKCLKSLEKK
jgi:hypothetical protein